MNHKPTPLKDEQLSKIPKISPARPKTMKIDQINIYRFVHTLSSITLQPPSPFLPRNIPKKSIPIHPHSILNILQPPSPPSIPSHYTIYSHSSPSKIPPTIPTNSHLLLKRRTISIIRKAKRRNPLRPTPSMLLQVSRHHHRRRSLRRYLYPGIPLAMLSPFLWSRTDDRD